MYVAGTVPDSRRAVCALRTCMRSWRTRKSGRPLLVEGDDLAVDEQVAVTRGPG